MGRKPSSPDPPPNSLSIRLGGWFEAHATGFGVAAIPVVVALLALVAAMRWLLGG